MARRTLEWLAALFWAMTGLAAAWSWAARREALPPPPVAVTSNTTVLLAAALATTALAIMFRLMAAALRRRSEAGRSLGQLQIVASAIAVVVVVIGLLGDFSTALVSVGLVGFGLTLALQRPLLSLAGWATIFFGGMFREGDRIQVGDIQGDVLSVTLFTTRLWEIGALGRPTGRILTVSNAQFLEEPVANATNDTAIVFDEFVVNVAFEADLDLAKRLLAEAGDDVLDPSRHQELAKTYRKLTKGLRMEAVFPDRPFILMESQPSWMDLRLRYLVDARKASTVRTQLTAAWATKTAPHGDAIPPVYPRSQPMRIGGDGRPLDS